MGYYLVLAQNHYDALAMLLSLTRFFLLSFSLKKQLGAQHLIGSVLPVPAQMPTLEPLAILDRKMVKRGNRAATKVLIHWKNSFPEDATWEFLHDMQLKFPDCGFDSQP
ncbi:hypothetical protein CCACVL1_04628 [Corchorus capsularis]|uniref:Chromo domain-containing protein n=1 Tax=Corchorus capsularis TaxID=210143 RepID=A0A1R3JQT5_COCAP|nr:hypothetical protein CCACVL1_04628 [Corchorus capsularis]